MGAFYARFGDKESLLRCLFERFYEQAEATARAALEPERWSDVELADLVAATVEFTARTFAAHRGLIAALARYAADRPELGSPAHALGQTISHGLVALANHRGERFAHPDPERGVELCVWMVLSSLASWAQAGGDQAPPADPAAFAAEVTRMCLGYLISP